ncbi:hypothetical protein A2U01_0088728, partial [Trifolium medium]|nr:hypothetical protein [Trifolium medium]
TVDMEAAAVGITVDVKEAAIGVTVDVEAPAIGVTVDMEAPAVGVTVEVTLVFCFFGFCSCCSLSRKRPTTTWYI